MTDKPKMQLLGHDGNIYAVMGHASRLLKENGQPEAAKEMYERVTSSGSYNDALMIVSEYVETELSAYSGKAQRVASQSKRKDPHRHER